MCTVWRGTSVAPGTRTRAVGGRPSARPEARGASLGRVRALFVLLVAVVLVVQLIEVADARTPWWPHRSAALVALAAGAWWAHQLHRRGRPTWWLEAVAPLAVLATGIGLGRHGAVLALLIGVTQHRGLYGTRRSLVLATCSFLVAYLAVGATLDGARSLVDLGSLVVVVGIGGIVAIIRLVAETLAWHDVSAGWDTVLNDAVADLLAASSVEEVDEVVDGALGALTTRAPVASGGLWERPVPAAAIPVDHVALAATGASVWSGHPGGLHRTLRRLASDASLARERVESERRYRLLAEHSRDGIYLLELGETPTYRYLNPAAEAMLGLTSDDVADDADLAVARIHADDRALVREARARTGAILDPVRVRVCRDDGTTVWVEAAETVVETHDGSPRLVQGVVRDVTRQRAQEEALHRALLQEQAAADELRHLDGMKSTFLQAVSHELRTPLTAVLGSAETLRDHHGELGPEDLDRLLEAVARQARRLGRLLDDLLDVDRLSRGRVLPERRPTALQEVVERAIDGLGEDAERVELDVDRIVADLDGAQVERIVENLLRNAVKHTPRGTPIRLQVREQAGVTVIVVEDDGYGVPEGLREAVWAPFAQGPHADGAPSPGTGIGLALVRQLAELHGGEAWVEDGVGGGARFVVVLPGPRAGERDGAAAVTSAG
jgi:PAS domain S-box-containing protein